MFNIITCDDTGMLPPRDTESAVTAYNYAMFMADETKHDAFVLDSESGCVVMHADRKSVWFDRTFLAQFKHEREEASHPRKAKA